MADRLPSVYELTRLFSYLSISEEQPDGDIAQTKKEIDDDNWCNIYGKRFPIYELNEMKIKEIMLQHERNIDHELLPGISVEIQVWSLYEIPCLIYPSAKLKMQREEAETNRWDPQKTLDHNLEIPGYRHSLEHSTFVQQMEELAELESLFFQELMIAAEILDLDFEWEEYSEVSDLNMTENFGEWLEAADEARVLMGEYTDLSFEFVTQEKAFGILLLFYRILDDMQSNNAISKSDMLPRKIEGW